MRPITQDDLVRLENPAHLVHMLADLKGGEQLPYAVMRYEPLDRTLLGHAWDRYASGAVELVQERIKNGGQIVYWAIGRHHIRPLKKEKEKFDRRSQ